MLETGDKILVRDQSADSPLPNGVYEVGQPTPDDYELDEITEDTDESDAEPEAPAEPEPADAPEPMSAGEEPQ